MRGLIQQVQHSAVLSTDSMFPTNSKVMLLGAEIEFSRWGVHLPDTTNITVYFAAHQPQVSCTTHLLMPGTLFPVCQEDTGIMVTDEGKW